MKLEDFKMKYPFLKEDLETMTDDDRAALGIRICGCGAMNEQWCCSDPHDYD